MTTDELLLALPGLLGNNGGKGCYFLHKPKDQIGYLTLCKEGGNPPWIAYYDPGDGGYLCMNPEAKEPPYNYAVAWGSTPKAALQALYDWCVHNGLIKDEKAD